MRKRLCVGIAALGAGLILAGCGSQAVATINGNNISKDAYYRSLKNSPEGKEILRDMILNKGLEQQYGSQVSAAEVDAKYAEYKQQSGSGFETFLKQNGLTARQFKDRVHDNLLLRAAIRSNTKFTPKMLRHQFKSFEPKITVNQILVPSAAKARTVIQQLAAGTSFSALAKRYSTDSATKNKSGRIAPFDNSNTALDPAFKAAAFKLKNGDYTKVPVKTQYGYEVIQMIQHPKKGSIQAHENELKDQIVTQKMGDSASLQAIAGKVLKHGHVSIHDKALQSTLGHISGEKS